MIPSAFCYQWMCCKPSNSLYFVRLEQAQIAIPLFLLAWKENSVFFNIAIWYYTVFGKSTYSYLLSSAFQCEFGSTSEEPIAFECIPVSIVIHAWKFGQAGSLQNSWGCMKTNIAELNTRPLKSMGDFFPPLPWVLRPTMVCSLLGQKVSGHHLHFSCSCLLSLCWAVTGPGHDSALPQHSHRLDPFPPV